LRNVLSEAGAAPRGPDEFIVLEIPRRNIETWLRYLEGESVDEATDYGHRRGRESDCAKAVAAMVKHIRQRNPAPSLPSLREGVDEFRRIR